MIVLHKLDEINQVGDYLIVCGLLMVLIASCLAQVWIIQDL